VNRRGFLRGLLGVAVAPVAARVAPVIEAVAPAQPATEPVMGVGRCSPLTLDNLGMHVNCRCAELPCEVVDTDAVLPLYIDDNGGLTVGGKVTAHDSDAQLDRLLADIDRAPERNAAMTREMLPLTSADLDRAVRDYAAGLKA
jgi:hypothetical protein